MRSDKMRTTIALDFGLPQHTHTTGAPITTALGLAGFNKTAEAVKRHEFRYVGMNFACNLHKLSIV